MTYYAQNFFAIKMDSLRYELTFEVYCANLIDTRVKAVNGE